MNAFEASIAEDLNEDPAFQNEGIVDRSVQTHTIEGKAVAIFDTAQERDRVAVVDLPEGNGPWFRSLSNVLFARIYGKVVA